MTSKLESLLDDAGWRILDALQEDARLSFNELGRRIGLSAPAIAERIRRMEEAGVISGYRVAIRLDKLYPIQALVRLHAPEESCVALAARTRELREVIEVYRVTGDDRLVLKVATGSVQHLDWLINDLSRFATATVSLVLQSRTRSVTKLSPPLVVHGATVIPGDAKPRGDARRRRRASSS